MHGNWMIEVNFELDDFRPDYLGKKKIRLFFISISKLFYLTFEIISDLNY